MNDLYDTELLSFVDEGGYILSIQNNIFIADIDNVYYKKKINLIVFEEDGRHLFSVKNKPFKISHNQKFFDVKIINKEKIEYFLNLKTYLIDTRNDSFIKELHLNKKIYKNFIRFYINKDELQNGNMIIFLDSSKYGFDPRYDLKCHISKEASEDFILKYGENKLIEEIEKKIKEYKASGHLYKTQNGLRLILTDKFRKNEDYAQLAKDLYSDSKYINTCLLAGRYGCRLTPKLKNYKLFDKSYNKLISNLSNNDIATSIIENDGGTPIKFDLKNIYFKDDKQNKKIEKYFIIFKDLVTGYIKREGYAICRKIKKFKFSEENPEILQFLDYHDKWTKANKENTILI